jgi:hypothetical protein
MRLYILTGLLIISFNPLKSQHFEFSRGLYRIGYENNVVTTVNSDVYTHDPLGKYDLVTDANDPDIVAAADGWIRWIKEDESDDCHPLGDGNPCCWWKNNYVIMEHPNGEWTGYTHIQQWSATNAGIEVGDWVTVGTPIGIEGTVGCSTGDHLHFEISRPEDTTDPFDTIGGFLSGHGELLIPVTCGILPNNPWLTHGDVRISSPCDDNCQTAWEVNNSVGNGQSFIARADQYVVTGTSQDVIFSNGSTTQFRAGDYITLKPGFHVKAGSKFAAILRDCNQQN